MASSSAGKLPVAKIFRRQSISRDAHVKEYAQPQDRKMCSLKKQTTFSLLGHYQRKKSTSMFLMKTASETVGT